MKSFEGEEGDSGANGVTEDHQGVLPEEREQGESFAQNAQQSGTEEPRCDHNRSTAATSEPSATSGVSGVSSLDPEKFFKLLAESQSRRMDDQRVSPCLLPGLQVFSSKGSGLMNQWESDQLCKFIIRAQRSRMEDQRCSPPKIILTPDSPVTPRKSSLTQDPDTNSQPPRRSASLSSEKMPTDNNTPIQTLSPAEQERLLSLVCQAQRGRMEDQRCYLDPSKRTPPPQGIPNVIPPGVDIEHLFKLVAKIQSNRLDDQRVALSFLPGIQMPRGDTQVPLAQDETEKFYNTVSRVQSQRMDEQRCYAPHIQLGTPAPPRKVYTEPGSPKQDPPKPKPFSKPSRRSSAAISPPSDTQQWHQNNDNHTVQTPASNDQEQYFSMVQQAQGCMENERCAFGPNAFTTEQFFSLVANFQGKRMDDQRAALPPAQTEKPSIPQIILTPESPAAPRRASSRPTSLTQEPASPTRPPPRSASFSPVSDKERMQYDSNVSSKLTFQVSVCLTPPKQGNVPDSPNGSHPDVFLMIGPPGGQSFVLPLTPMVCGPTSLEAATHSRRHHSRSSSPHSPQSRMTHSRSSSPTPSPQPCPIGADEDYFSLIQRVHTAQLQQGSAAEKGREAGRGRGKGDGRRERKDRMKKK